MHFYNQNFKNTFIYFVDPSKIGSTGSIPERLREKPRESIERPDYSDIGREFNQEISKEKFQGKRTEVFEFKKGERRDVALDQKATQIQENIEQQKLDEETPRSIEAWDYNRPLNYPEQITLQTVLTSLITKAQEKKLIDEEIKSPFELSLKLGSHLNYFNASERSLIRKFGGLLEHRDSFLDRQLRMLWPQIKQDVDKSTKEVEKIKSDPIKYFNGLGGMAKAAIAIVGAYAAYKLVLKPVFNFLTEKNSENKPEKKGGIIGKLALILIPLLAFGGLFKGKELIDWFKEKLNYDFSLDNIKNFFENLIKNPWEAITSFFSKDKNKEKEKPDEEYNKLHESTIKEIEKVTGKKIKPETIKQMGKEKFTDFYQENIFEKFIDDKIQEWGIFSTYIPIDAFKTGFIEDSRSIRSYLKTHEEEINKLRQAGKITDDTKVNQVLEMILNPDESYSESSTQEEIQEKQERETYITSLNSPEKKTLAREFEKNLLYLPSDKLIQSFLEKGEKSQKINIDLLKKLFAEKQTLMAEYCELLQSNAPIEEIKEKIAQIHETYLDINEELKALYQEIMIIKNDETLLKLLLLQHDKILKALKTYLTAPAIYKEYRSFRRSKKIREAAQFISEKTKTPKELMDQKISQSNTRVSEIDTEITQKQTAQAITIDESERKKLKYEIENLNDQKKYHQFIKDLNEQKKLLLDKEQLLKTTSVPADRTRIEGEIKTLKAQIDDVNIKKLDIEGRVLNIEARNLRTTLESDFGLAGESNKVIKSKHFEKIDNVGKKFLEYRSSLEEIIHKKATLLEEELIKMDKGLAHDPTLIDKLKNEINDITKKQTNMEKNLFIGIDGFLNRSWQKIQEALHLNKITGPQSKQEIQKLREYVLKVYENQRIAKRQTLTGKIAQGILDNKLFKIGGKKAKAIFLTTQLTIGTTMNTKETEGGKKVGIAQAATQTIADLAPVTGTLSDLYSAASGKEYFTGKSLEFGDRMWRLGFGLAGIPCDIASLAGIGLFGRTALGSLKAARLAGKGIDMARAADILKDSSKTTKELIEGNKTLKTITKVGDINRKIIIGTSLATIGVGLTITAADYVYSKGMQMVMGDSIEELVYEAV
ncbi:MAG: hypothetical protein UR27_C0004G0043 [Candidatus Peregrinibacteria bacterium GW2011_GWA2_33_10]|nr:MAG: hypothetical protein UR27_C0004G0043 [Candidatus Peregrinibacteria bacterium GW2011_GWA2_33_10]KKP41156.1 MAG: hypothetical protein UR30_C0001G0003 [Candidatus Peregrinibacteria bacterium GW2011_GWC2_33_13]OGJ50381.1 MAG: hypothetical protein A2229_00165 [Candidatus Peregrinibacteria bacterium RIFOXYA2_FULL_33_7]